MNEEKTKEFIEAMGVQIVGSSPEFYREWLDKNTALWAELADSLKIEKR